jgi:hypothetical protein
MSKDKWICKIEPGLFALSIGRCEDSFSRLEPAHKVHVQVDLSRITTEVMRLHKTIESLKESKKKRDELHAAQSRAGLKTKEIVINFPFPIELPPGFEHALSVFVGMACKKYEAEHPDRSMWASTHGWDEGCYGISVTEREAHPRELQRRANARREDTTP